MPVGPAPRFLAYNADGQRVRRTISGLPSPVWNIYGFDGELLAEYPANGAASSPQKEYGYRNGQLLISAEAETGATNAQDVIWANTVGVSVSGNSLTKTASYGWGNAGAVSTQSIASGDGYVEFTAAQLAVERICGLSVGDSNQSHEDIDFGILLSDGGYIYGWESGVMKINAGAYATSDKLRVAVEGGQVKYYKNGTLFYTSSATPAYPLIVDTAIRNTGASISNVVISGASGGSSSSVKWLVTDQLGTPRMVIDQSGSLSGVKRHDYLPFGEELSSVTGLRSSVSGYSGDAVRQKFTRKERDNESGLDYFINRYYSSAQGRFTGVDPENAGASPEDPQSWNGYAYARNNPVLYTDPDGQKFKICYQDGNCHEVSDAEFNRIKSDATKLGSVFKDNKIYNEVDGQLVETASYTRTSFDDLNDFANGVIFGNRQTPGLTQRLVPVQQVVEVGAHIAATVISGGTSLGATGGITLGLGARAAFAGRGITTIGQGLSNVRAIGSGRLAGYLRGNTNLQGDAQAARETFRQLTGRDPVGNFDRVVQAGKEVVYRGTSGSGKSKVEIVDHAQRFLEKITFK